MLMCSLASAVAQQYAGSWKVYSAFDEVSAIADTPDKVYYVSTGQLYSYDKASEETYNFTGSLKLSSPNIAEILYDSDSRQLVVVYENADIDIIDSKGRVENIPDIKDAQLSVVPTVYDMTVDGGKLYVATNFGVVVFDLKKYQVITSGDYGKEMFSAVVWGDYLMLTDGDANNYYAGKDDNLTTFSKFTYAFGLASPEYMALSDDIIAVIQGENHLIVYKKNSPDAAPVLSNLSCLFDKNLPGKCYFARTADGEVVCYSPEELFFISKDGQVKSVSTAGTDLAVKKIRNNYKTQVLSALGGENQMWLGSSDGISSYRIDSTGKIEQLTSPVKPQNALTFSNIGRLYTSPSGKIYVANYGAANIRQPFLNQTDDLFHINVIEDGEVSDVTPLEFTVDNRSNKSLNTDPVGFKSGADLREDPNDPDAFYIGSCWDGVYYFKDRKQIRKYYDYNSSLKTVSNGYALRAYALDIDRTGNLWVSNYVQLGNDIIHMLPADKRSKDNTAIADWSSVDPCARSANAFEHQLLACRKSNCVLYRDSQYNGSLHVVKTGGTTSTSDNVVYLVDDFIDQDGKVFTYNYLWFIVEDKLGAVWVGTDNGIFSIANPDDINGNSIRVNHLKVPRKDGSNFADYLLDGETIYWIAVDPANRKWVATANSGAYLVSASGDEIIRHFDTTNSPLQSNLVSAVACGDENSVFLSTQFGLLEYRSDASQGHDDFDDVYAYPNPVRPEYTGWITVTGLMDNSLVKIADAAGNVFFQGMSEGGMITWDGCDRSGNRVKTGVYYVFASSGESGQSSSGAVTKILVVN